MTTPDARAAAEAMREAAAKIAEDSVSVLKTAAQNMDSRPCRDRRDEEDYSRMSTGFLARARDAEDITAKIRSLPLPDVTGGDLPLDVRNLVIAAREVAFVGATAESIKALDAASEEFADRVPWKDEPEESE